MIPNPPIHFAVLAANWSTWDDGWTANIKSPWQARNRRLPTMSPMNNNEMGRLCGIVDRNL
jgi:hypothetical protein